MISVIEQEIIVDDLLEVEKKLFKLSEQLGSDTELDEACILSTTAYKRRR